LLLVGSLLVVLFANNNNNKQTKVDNQTPRSYSPDTVDSSSAPAPKPDKKAALKCDKNAKKNKNFVHNMFHDLFNAKKWPEANESREKMSPSKVANLLGQTDQYGALPLHYLAANAQKYVAMTRSEATSNEQR